MDDTQLRDTYRLLQALNALRRSTERAIHTGSTEGIAPMALNGFNRLNARARELLTDDFYITDVLVVEINPDAPADTVLAQVVFATEQMGSYLEDLLRDEMGEEYARYQRRRRAPRPPRPPRPPFADFGRDISESIIEATRSSLSRAISGLNVDVEFSPGSTISGVRYLGRNFGGYRLDGVTIEESVFSGSNFGQASFVGATLQDVDVKGTDFSRATFDEATLKDVRLTGANLSAVSMVGATLNDVSLKGANLAGADLTNTVVVSSDFRGCNLSGATLTGVTFESVALDGARLPDGTIYEVGTDISRFTVGGEPPEPDAPVL